MVRFRVSVNASGELRGQLGDLAPGLINDLRRVIRVGCLKGGLKKRLHPW